MKYALLVVWSVAVALAVRAEVPYDELVTGIKIPKGCYVDTGHAVKSNPKVTMACKVLSVASGQDVDLFGTDTAKTGCFILNADQRNFFLRHGTSSSTSVSSAFSLNEAFLIVCDNTVVKNGKVLKTVTPGDLSSNEDTLKFPGKRRPNFALTVASFKLEDGGRTVCDMVACRAGGKLCFYDKTSGNLFDINGSGTPEVDDVSLPSVWTGAAGDGLWSTPGNWLNDAVPTTSSSVVIPANTADTMDAGLEERVLASLEFVQPVGSFTLKGAGLRVNDNVTLKMYGGKTVTIDCPLALTGDSRKLTLGSSTNSVLTFKQPVSAATISASSFTGSSQDKGNTAKIRFAAPMDYSTLELQYNNIVCDAANILSPTGVVHFTGTGWGELHHGVTIDLNGFDQTIHGIKSTESAQYPLYNTSEGWQARARTVKSTGRAATLTIRSANDDSSSCRFADNLSIVFAPTTDAVQSFIKRPNTMNGFIVISNGTFRIAEEATFKNVKYIAVYPGATLQLTEDSFKASTNALSGLVELYVAPGATLDLPTGTGATLPVTSTDGVHYYKTAAAAGVTEWRTTTGDWATAANWSQGVPSKTLAAQISALGEPMSVSVAADAAPATNVTIVSNARQPVELALSAMLPLERGFVDIGCNAKVTVKSGGRLETTAPRALEKLTDTVTARLIVHKDGELIVENGGSVAVSNAYGRVLIGDADGSSAGRLEVQAGGDFSFFSGQTGTVFAVFGDSVLDIKGRLAVYRRYKNSRKPIFTMNGGTINLSGDGILEFPNDVGTYAGNGGQINVNFDSITAVGNSSFGMGANSTWDTDVVFKPKTTGRDTTLRLSDNASFTKGWGHLALNSIPETRTFYDLGGTTHGFYNPGGESCLDLTIGCNGGYTRFDYGGADFTIGTFGFNVGHYSGSGNIAETNLVNVRSAVITSYATTAVNQGSGGLSWPYSRHYGMMLGVHTKNSVEITKEQIGLDSRLNLLDADSGLDVSHGHFLVGVGRAAGHFVQHDGTTQVAMASPYGAQDKNTNLVTVVGAWGGVGELIVSNGTFTTRQRTFVGGVATNDYVTGDSINGKTGSRHLEYHDAEGLVRVAGGTFTANREIFVGKDGSGTFEIGSRGVLTGTELNLMSPTATLKFSLDAANGYRSGASSVKKLVVAEGASLVIDVGDYHGKSRNLLLVSEMEGDFGDNISVVGENANDYSVGVSAGRIFLRSNFGTVILLR